ATLAQARRGVVYRAVDEENGETCCLRLFDRSAKFDWHPVPEHLGIVARHGTGEIRGVPFGAYDLVVAPTLAHAGGAAADVLPVLLRTVGALQHHGLVHGHVRANNLFMIPGRGPVIADYGLATGGSDLKSYLPLLAVLAPERLASVREADRSTDMYGIGVIGYELLTGRLPFDPSMRQRQLVRAVVEEMPPRPPGPPHLVELVMALLEKSPAARPTADEAMERSLPRL
ncbi:MAG: protein kinase, partial [Planctomycetota bacterium]